MCAHIRYWCHWGGATPLFHSLEPGSGTGRDHPDIMQSLGPVLLLPLHCLFPRCLGLESCEELLGSHHSYPHPIRLFQMNVGPAKKLEELDPETREYWRLLRKHNIWRHNRLSKNRKF